MEEGWGVGGETGGVEEDGDGAFEGWDRGFGVGLAGVVLGAAADDNFAEGHPGNEKVGGDFLDGEFSFREVGCAFGGGGSADFGDAFEEGADEVGFGSGGGGDCGDEGGSESEEGGGGD